MQTHIGNLRREVKMMFNFQSYFGKRVKVMFNFAHLDHDKGVDLDAGNSGEDGEGGVGDHREEGGVGKAHHHNQDTREDRSSLEGRGTRG